MYVKLSGFPFYGTNIKFTLAQVTEKSCQDFSMSHYQIRRFEQIKLMFDFINVYMSLLESG